MSRFQISINVADADAAAAFYEKLLGVPPAKHRPGYSNFVVADPPLKLIVIENEGAPGTINHLGIEVADTDAVAEESERLRAQELPMKDDPTHTCCFATQDKVWTIDPDEVPWEVYTVLDHTEHFGARAH